MSRASLALLVVLLLLPLASAQMRFPVGMVSSGEVSIGPGGNTVELRVEMRDKEFYGMEPWIVAGHDNVMNLTVHNAEAEAINATFRLNVTGGTASETTVVVHVPPYGSGGTTFVLHAPDPGVVEVVAEATDAFQPDGDPLSLEIEIPALLLPSMRFVDPPIVNMTAGDPEFVRANMMMPGSADGEMAFLRIPPGASVEPRLQLTNPFEVALAEFDLRLAGAPRELPLVRVPSLDPGETTEVSFEAFIPMEGGHFFGGMGSFELRPSASVTLNSVRHTVTPLEFDVDRGAVVEPRIVRAAIIVQDGLAVDLFVPRVPVLGVPTRVLYNLTNLDTTPLQGTLTISLMTPNNLYYEVQAPEAHQLHVAMGPGERSSGAIQLTPRVTGHWQVSTVFQGDMRFGYGGSASFEVKGPLTIGFDQTDQVFARIGEPIDVGVVISARETVQDAQLRVASGSNYYRDPTTVTGSDHRPGLVSRLIDTDTPTRSLGTLRPGGDVNTSIQLVARASGTYNIVPYILAEGFAYTSTVDSGAGPYPVPFDGPMHASTLYLLVQPRAVPPGVALAPLTLGLAFFVGMWTLRTRFVK